MSSSAAFKNTQEKCYNCENGLYFKARNVIGKWFQKSISTLNPKPYDTAVSSKLGKPGGGWPGATRTTDQPAPSLTQPDRHDAEPTSTTYDCGTTCFGGVDL